MELAESVTPKRETTQADLGYEMNLTNLTRIRFGTDRRLDEVLRMLQSSSPPSVKLDERVVK
jgi:hypothetical protein